MTFRMFVRESVDHILISVKAMRNEIEILGVAGIVATEHRVRDMVRNLNEARGPRVHEERRVCNILKHAPLGSDFSELPAKFLQGCLSRRLVENYHPALWISRSFPAA